MKFADFINDLEKSSNHNQSFSKLELVLEILKKINSSLVLEDVLELVLRSSINITKSERGFIVLKGETGELETVLCLDAKGHKLPKDLFNISTTVVNDVYLSGQSKFIESALNDSTNTSRSIINLELQTIMCAPLISEGEKIGVIYVDSRFLNKIDSKEITETFEILASQAGIAINNAMMHQRQLKANHELKKAYIELELAKQEAEKFEMLKNHFLTQMSHEIRTPFNIILSSLYLLKSETMLAESSEIKELFSMLEDGSKRIIRTVDRILEMSKIRSGNYELNEELINLGDDILSQVIKHYEEVAINKGIYLIFQKTTDKNEVTRDKFMIYQLFQEIIDNAVKFTNYGTVRIKQYENNEGKLSVSIKDTGIGISSEYLQRIFEPFSQEDTGPSRRYEGNGLALALVKKYAELSNISLVVKSEKNVGSEFTVVFN